eukprot:CAMPEP_0201727586 /NCGR_PEP_ID=MMETSP0593-20130828/12866_1 /ASSEMBLY_ACC=CAM_ASM_000672 /TAXON_ID=267983 /ORGANISM="Skeletonema japonicum, Strain CCMP2506" /LENGTH=65 /DNA_ID=CAMNT_0048219445 /DNA_START=19 /DNA_END=213 /DNA_ORIENTATION=-
MTYGVDCSSWIAMAMQRGATIWLVLATSRQEIEGFIGPLLLTTKKTKTAFTMDPKRQPVQIEPLD